MAGKLLDVRLQLYECKVKRPSLRIYFQIVFNQNIAKIIEFEIKKSSNSQIKIIDKIKKILKS